MTKLTHVEPEHAKGMLQANVTILVAAKQYRCHVRMSVCLKNSFQQAWTTSNRPRPGRPCVLV